MGQSRVDAGAIPVPDLKAAALTTAASTMKTHSGSIRTGGADVKSTWAGLSAFYDAPEDVDLFAVMDPIATRTDLLAGDGEQVASALSKFATEAGPLVATLKQTRIDAQAFRDRTASDDDWDHSQDNVDENNRYVHTVNTTIVAFQAAERTCANAIESLFGGKLFHTVTTEADANDPYAYGYDSIPDNAKTPWGAKVEKKDGCLGESAKAVGHFAVGFVEGAWNTIKGLGLLVWNGVGLGGWDKFKQTWEGIGNLALIATPWLGMAVWGPKGYADRATAMGKALIHYDDWQTDPAKAAGECTFDLLALLVPASKAGKAGELAEAGEAANAASKVEKVLAAGQDAFSLFNKVTNPFELVKGLPKVFEFANDFKLKFGDTGGLVQGIDGQFSKWDDLASVGGKEPVSPHFDAPQVDAPHVDAPHVDAPHTDTPSTGGSHTGTADHPTGTADHPTGTADHPTGTADHPTGTADHPTGTADHPTGTADHPTGTADHPTGTADHPHDYVDANGARHFEGDPPGTSRDVNGGLHDAKGHYVTDPQAPIHHPADTVPAVKGSPVDHPITAANHEQYAHDVQARSELATDHTSLLRTRNELAAELKVPAADLTKDNLSSTIARLQAHADPAALDKIDDLQQAALKEQKLAAELNQSSEQLGMSAGRDVIDSRGGDVIIGAGREAGRPGELDLVGVHAGDHPTLRVVEAKGGDSAQLGARNTDSGVRAQQGSTPYLNDLIHRDPRLADYLADNPQFARDLADGKVEISYELVVARSDGRVIVTEFQIDAKALDLSDLGPQVAPLPR